MEKNNSGLSIASMVCGIVALAFFFIIPFMALAIGIVGLSLGAVSLAKRMNGRKMAISGVICSLVSILGILILCVRYAFVLMRVYGL